MSNLLPPTFRTELIRQYRTRLVFIAALALIGIALIALILLVSSYVVISGNQSSATDAQAASTTGVSATDRATLTQVQSRVALLGPLTTASSSAAEAIRVALNARPSSGITLDHISYARRASGNQSSLTIGGFSQAGTAIDTYRRALIESGRFADVSVPVGARVGVGDGKFTITLSGAF